jgi:hypothetical protein
MSSPARFLLLVLLAIVGVKMSEQLYGLVVFRDERSLARGLRARLVDSGAELVALRHRADSLKEAIEAEDDVLEREHRGVRSGRYSASRGLLTGDEYARYTADVDRYNRHVVERNGMLRELEAAHDRLLRASGRYNGLADSLHALAVRMRQPYYQVPTPLEAAEERRRAP